MRYTIRLIVVCFILAALVAAGPLAAGPRAGHSSIPPPAIASESFSLWGWLGDFVAWFGEILEGGASDFVQGSSTSETPAGPSSSSTSEPDFGVSPQHGPEIDPNG